MLDEFMSGDSYVLEVRLDAFPDYAMVRCAPKRPLAFMDAMGKWALLHGPRDESRTGYFGVARIDSFELHPRGSSTLVFLDEVEIFDTPVSTVLHDGRPRENAPEDLNGNLAFSFYSDGLRPISDERFDAILEAAGHGRALTMGELGETTPSDHPPTVPYRPDLSPEDRVIEGYKIEQRRIRAKLRAQLVRGGGGAFCCMSGASFDLPDSFSLLQLGHFWPLGHHGPDVLTNVGFMTGNIHP